MGFWRTTLSCVILLYLIVVFVTRKNGGETSSCITGSTEMTYIRPSDVHLNNLWEQYYMLDDGENKRVLLKLFHRELSHRFAYVQLQQQPPYETPIMLPLCNHNTIRSPDIRIMSLWWSYLKSADGEKRMAALKRVHMEVSHRVRFETNLEKIAAFLFGPEAVSSVLAFDDQRDTKSVVDCSESLIQHYVEHLGCSFTEHCGYLYALVEKICRNNITPEKMEAAFVDAGLYKESDEQTHSAAL